MFCRPLKIKQLLLRTVNWWEIKSAFIPDTDRQQVINLVNGVLGYWRIYESLDLNLLSDKWRQHVAWIYWGYNPTGQHSQHTLAITQRAKTHSIESFVTLLKAYIIDSYSCVCTDIKCYSCEPNVIWFCQQAFSLLKIGFQRPSGFESCIQQRKTSCLLSIRKSLACARASKLTTTNTDIKCYSCGPNVMWFLLF